MKMKNFLTCDTETIGLPPENFVYDLGYTIANRKDVLLRRSFLVREIVTDADKMMGAFYAKKIFSHYIPTLDAGEIKIFDWAEVVATMRADMIAYDVSVFAAYNIKFDMTAIGATNKLLASGKVLEYKPDLLDLWTFACGLVFNTRSYHDMAAKFGWVSEANNVRTTAEKAYAAITGEFDFIEQHTALHDAEIETVILQRMLARKKTIPYNRIHEMPWQLAQTIRGELI